MHKRKLGEEEAVCSRENWVRRRQYTQEKTGEEEAVCSRETWVRRQYA
jgi:hypothetical protein